MAASTYLDQVQQLYIAYFGRPADPVGQRYWAQVIDDAGGHISSVLSGFSASNESQALYGASNTAQKVTAIYSNVFNRAPEAGGLAYWIDQIDSGKVTQAQAAWAIQQAAGPGDASTVNNKLIAANVFTNNIDTSAELAGYNGSASAAVARAFLNKVDASYASIANVTTYAVTDVATATGTGAVVAPVVPVAPTFSTNLTAGVVSFSGTATGDITVSWSGTVGASDATFSRGGIVATAVHFGGAGGASSLSLAATDTLTGSVATLKNLTTTGLGSVHLTDTSAHLVGQFFTANSAHDVLTVTDAPTAYTSLYGLSGFETINLAGSTGTLTISGKPGAIINTSAAVNIYISGGGIFNGSSGDDAIQISSAGSGTNTLTGGGGNDHFDILGALGTSAGNSITDLSTGDSVSMLLSGSTSGRLTANNVSNFTADSVTSLTLLTSSDVTLNAAAGGSVIDMSSATMGNSLGVKINGGAGVDIIKGSAGADILSGGAGADTFVFTTLGHSKSTAFDTITDFTSGTDLIKTGVTNGVTSLNQGASYTAAGTGTLATDIAAAVAAGNAAGTPHIATANDAYVVVITGTGAGTYIFQDTSGEGAVGANELVIKLTGSTTLTAADFVA